MTGAEDGLLVVIDPLWTATDDEPEPPSSAIVGGWARVDGEIRDLFRPKPDYRPRSPGSPLDPVDDVLRRIAVDEQGVALARPAPDGVSTVLVATHPGIANE